MFKLFDNDVDEAEFGVSTGWEVMNDFYRVVPGELCIVTGVPNSGKSEWIDALMVNLASNFGWTFALCSMENRVRDHARKLAEKYMNKSFFGGSRAWYSTDAMRQLSRQELEQAMGWIEAHFCLIRRDADAAMMDIDWILQRATMAVRRYGIRGLVIDPYNELEHRRPPNQTETEYVSQLLSKVKRFAQNHGVHVWFVAHPKQLSNWNPVRHPGAPTFTHPPTLSGRIPPGEYLRLKSLGGERAGGEGCFLTAPPPRRHRLLAPRRTSRRSSTTSREAPTS